MVKDAWHFAACVLAASSRAYLGSPKLTKQRVPQRDERKWLETDSIASALFLSNVDLDRLVHLFDLVVGQVVLLFFAIRFRGIEGVVGAVLVHWVVVEFQSILGSPDIIIRLSIGFLINTS